MPHADNEDSRIRRRGGGAVKTRLVIAAGALLACALAVPAGFLRQKHTEEQANCFFIPQYIS